MKEHPALIMNHGILQSAMESQETVVSRLVNPTCLPTELLETVIPIIFIKHPALVIPSWLKWANSEDPDRYHADDDEVTLWTSMRWARMLFDYMRTSQHMQRVPGRRRHSLASPVVSSWPFVLDDTDVTDNTHATLATLCRVLGIEGDGASNWDPGRHFRRAGEKLRRSSKDNVFDAYTRRVSIVQQEGTGRRHSVTEPTVSIDTEYQKWKEQFGEAIAKEIRRKVEEEMPHYDYLKKFRLRPQRTATVSDYRELMDGLPRRRRSDAESPVSPSDADTPVSAMRHVRSAVDLKSLQGAG